MLIACVELIDLSFPMFPLAAGLYYAIASIVVAVVAFIFSDLFYLNTQTASILRCVQIACVTRRAIGRPAGPLNAAHTCTTELCLAGPCHPRRCRRPFRLFAR